MTDTYKSLGQVVATGGDDNVYTVPASTAAIVSAVGVANRGGNDEYVYVRVRVAGAALTNKQVVCAAVRVPANGLVTLVEGITLGAGDIVTCTGSSTNLTFNVWGVEQNPVPAIAPKVLGQANSSAGSDVDVYTVPLGKSAIVSTVTVANIGSRGLQRLAHAVGGGAAANKDYFLYDYAMPANPQTSGAPPDCNLALTLGITMAAGDKLRARSSVADAPVNVFGVEL